MADESNQLTTSLQNHYAVSRWQIFDRFLHCGFLQMSAKTALIFTLVAIVVTNPFALIVLFGFIGVPYALGRWFVHWVNENDPVTKLVLSQVNDTVRTNLRVYQFSEDPHERIHGLTKLVMTLSANHYPMHASYLRAVSAALLSDNDTSNSAGRILHQAKCRARQSSPWLGFYDTYGILSMTSDALILDSPGMRFLLPFVDLKECRLVSWQPRLFGLVTDCLELTFEDPDKQVRTVYVQPVESILHLKTFFQINQLVSDWHQHIREALSSPPGVITKENAPK